MQATCSIKLKCKGNQKRVFVWHASELLAAKAWRYKGPHPYHVPKDNGPVIANALSAPAVLLVQGCQAVDELVRVLVGPDRKVHVDDSGAILGQVAAGSLLQQPLGLVARQKRSCAHP